MIAAQARPSTQNNSNCQPMMMAKPPQPADSTAATTLPKPYQPTRAIATARPMRASRKERVRTNPSHRVAGLLPVARRRGKGRGGFGGEARRGGSDGRLGGEDCRDL